VNLLEHFVLQHVQVSLLKAKLISPPAEASAGKQDAKVELNLTPRMIKSDGGGELPAYQVSARLTCRGGTDGDKGPRFIAQVGYEVIYKQVSGNPLDVTEFTSNHPSLTRQLYPMLQQELRTLLVRLGLERIHLPYDLAAKIDSSENEKVQVSSAVH